MEYTGFIYLFIGMLSRAVLAFLVEVYKDENLSISDWEWKYLLRQLLGVAIVTIGLPLVLDKLPEVGSWDFQRAWLEGFAIAAATEILAMFGGEARKRLRS